MSSNKQRREHTRQQLQRQLEERRKREAARKRNTTIASVVGALVLVAAVVVIVVVSTSGDGKKKGGSAASSKSATTSASPTASASAATSTVPDPTAACAKPSGAKATFDGLTVTGATNLKKAPTVSGKGTGTPATVQCQDLVVGKGALVKDGDSITAQYVGLVYSTGKVFQSSWSSSAAPFTVAKGSVIDGFAEGIAGAGKITGMHVGGRRLIVMPAAAGYGASPPSGSGIPANAVLAFVVDVQKAS